MTDPTDNQEIEAEELTSIQFPWMSPTLPGETKREAVRRFAVEYLLTEAYAYVSSDGKFFFANSYWRYQIESSSSGWVVKRLHELSPKGKKRARARREAKS